MTIHTLSQAKSPVAAGVSRFVAVGGHVYPSSEKELTLFHGHLAANESQNQRDFQAFREGSDPRGGERVCIQKNSIPDIGVQFVLSELPLSLLHLGEPGVVGQVELERRDGDVALGERFTSVPGCGSGQRNSGLAQKYVRPRGFTRRSNFSVYGDTFCGSTFTPLIGPRSSTGMFTLNRLPSAGFVARICSTTCRAYRAAGREVVDLLVVLQRHGDGGAAVERALDRRGDGAGVEHVDAGVAPGVQPADDHVRRVGQQFQQRELHAVRRPALDRPADERLAVVLEHLADEQRVEQRDRVPGGALLGRRGDDRAPCRASGVRSAAPAGRGRRCRRRWSAESASRRLRCRQVIQRNWRAGWRGNADRMRADAMPANASVRA